MNLSHILTSSVTVAMISEMSLKLDEHGGITTENPAHFKSDILKKWKHLLVSLMILKK